MESRVEGAMVKEQRRHEPNRCLQKEQAPSFCGFVCTPKLRNLSKQERSNMRAWLSGGSESRVQGLLEESEEEGQLLQ